MLRGVQPQISPTVPHKEGRIKCKQIFQNINHNPVGLSILFLFFSYYRSFRWVTIWKCISYMYTEEFVLFTPNCAIMRSMVGLCPDMLEELTDFQAWITVPREGDGGRRTGWRDIEEVERNGWKGNERCEILRALFVETVDLHFKFKFNAHRRRRRRVTRHEGQKLFCERHFFTVVCLSLVVLTQVCQTAADMHAQS